MTKKGIKKTLTMAMAAAVVAGSALAATPVTVEAADPPVINDGCARPEGPGLNESIHIEINDGCARPEGPGSGESRYPEINDGCARPEGPGLNESGHIEINDGCARPGDNPRQSGGVDRFTDSDNSSDDENTVTEDLGRQEASTFNAGSDTGSGNNGGSTSESTSYSAPANDGGSTGSADYAGGSDDAGTSNGGQASASAPTGLALKGSTVSVPGCETWRQVTGAADGRLSVYHCGTEQYTLQLKDAEGKAVSYKSTALLQTEDGGWYINLETAGGVDTTGWTAGTVKGTAAYLPELGINGVAVNGTAVVDAAN